MQLHLSLSVSNNIIFIKLSLNSSRNYNPTIELTELSGYKVYLINTIMNFHILIYYCQKLFLTLGLANTIHISLFDLL